jgi:hypothetical protein
MAEALAFSVIITTHNRPRLVVSCVESGTDDPAEIIVDDGSRPARRTRSRRTPGRAIQYGGSGSRAGRPGRVSLSRARSSRFDDDRAAPPRVARRARLRRTPDASGSRGLFSAPG